MTPRDMARLHAAAFITDRAWTASEFESLLDSPHCHLTHAPYGFALWRAVAEEAELLTIATHPAHQRRGIATSLMHQWMTQAGDVASTAFLEVAADNAPAIALYHRFGFETAARRAQYYARSGDAVDALVMCARLPLL